MGWWERRQQRRRELEALLERDRMLASLTPMGLARRLESKRAWQRRLQGAEDDEGRFGNRQVE